MNIKIKIVSKIKMIKCIHILLENVKLGSISKGVFTVELRIWKIRYALAGALAFKEKCKFR